MSVLPCLRLQACPVSCRFFLPSCCPCSIHILTGHITTREPTGGPKRHTKPPGLGARRSTRGPCLLRFALAQTTVAAGGGPNDVRPTPHIGRSPPLDPSVDRSIDARSPRRSLNRKRVDRWWTERRRRANSQDDGWEAAAIERGDAPPSLAQQLHLPLRATPRPTTHNIYTILHRAPRPGRRRPAESSSSHSKGQSTAFERLLRRWPWRSSSSSDSVSLESSIRPTSPRPPHRFLLCPLAHPRTNQTDP